MLELAMASLIFTARGSIPVEVSIRRNYAKVASARVEELDIRMGHRGLPYE
jgi:hypothetical protein